MTSLSDKTINNALTRSNSAEIAGFAMPNSEALHEDITVKATGATYDPVDKNGYIMFFIRSTAAGQVVSLSANSVITSNWSSGGNQNMQVFLPIHKGEEFIAYYSGSVQEMKFIYAEGEI